MFKQPYPHFITGDFKPQNVFLGDQEYGLALDCLVKACTDLLICDKDSDDCKILLGKRIVEPQPDWWFMGGRMKPGETPEKSMARLVRRELKIEVATDRFRALGCHSYAWEKREQAPKENGTCDISVVFTFVVQPEELPAIKLDEAEYSESGWFGIDEIIEGDFHPALKASARDLRARHAWDKLVNLVQSNSAPEDVAQAATALVALR